MRIEKAGPVVTGGRKPLKAFARHRKYAGQARRLSRHQLSDIVRDETDNPFTRIGIEPDRRVLSSYSDTVQHQTPIGIDEDLNHGRFEKGGEDCRPERVAQGFQLAFDHDGVRRHSPPDWKLRGSSCTC